MRKKIIAGNWKMNKSNSEALIFASNLKRLTNETDNVDIVICAPFTALSELSKLWNGSNIKLGAQNLHFKDSGAFTGEISPLMLKDLKVEYVIIGHSERREYFKESDEIINQKIKTALSHDLKPIFCIGEKLDERKNNKMEIVLKNQLINGLKNFTKEEVKKIIIAYEPIWAIGTGETATPEQADSAHEFIRGILEEVFDKEVSQSVRIQYGGSMKPVNAQELLEKENIDGGLIGGASLKADDFFSIIKNA